MSVKYKGKEFKAKKNLKLRGKGISDISEIEGLSNLTNLISLNLAKNNISEIKGLENLTNLKRLDLRNNKIKEIKGLETLTNLTHLYLTLNEISKIKGLDTLNNLDTLILNGNKISEIDGLENLTNLTNLGLGGNTFREIKGLENLTKLKTLNIHVLARYGRVYIGDTKMPKKLRKALKIKSSGDYVKGGVIAKTNAQKFVEYCQHKKENKLDSPFAEFYDFRITPHPSLIKDNLNMQKICPTCKKVNKVSTNFCVGCGAKLGDV